MYVTVHRGTQQIGGNLVEIGTAHTRLLLYQTVDVLSLSPGVRTDIDCLYVAAV